MSVVTYECDYVPGGTVVIWRNGERRALCNTHDTYAFQRIIETGDRGLSRDGVQSLCKLFWRVAS